MKTSELLNRSLIDMYVRVDMRIYTGERYGTPAYWQRLEKDLLYEIKDMEEFIRDHRSRDYYNLSVEKTYEMHCKFCGHTFPDGYNGIVDCCDEALKLQQDDIQYLKTE